MSQSQSGPQPQYSPRGPVNPGTSPQAQSAAAPMWNPAGTVGLQRGDPMGNARPPMQRPQGPQNPPEPQYSPRIPAPDARRIPDALLKPQRTVADRHEAFSRAAEALHDRHYEDNNIRLEAELRLAEFFLA